MDAGDLDGIYAILERFEIKPLKTDLKAIHDLGQCERDHVREGLHSNFSSCSSE
ncbi:hypothetical protein ACQP1W_18930 [Spirillospora sp. CA-255316]